MFGRCFTEGSSALVYLGGLFARGDISWTSRNQKDQATESHGRAQNIFADKNEFLSVTRHDMRTLRLAKLVEPQLV